MARVGWIPFAIFICVFLSATYAYADCTTPAGVAGQFQYISSDYKYCDGADWQTMTVSDTGNVCATTGVLTKSGSDMQFCNGSHWISVSGATAASCAGTTAGTITWKSSDTRLEWCDGTDWKILGGSGGGGEPCAGKSIGEACDGTTALYAGAFDGGGYMIMPSGCADDTTDPTCSGGTDTVAKTWNDGTANWYDIPSVANITNNITPSSSAERGHYTTPILAAITAPAEGGEHKAARYCNDMVYGGYDDWYLPSKSELAYIYCKAAAASHSTLNPQENINCGGAGPSNELTGFIATFYWSSTEYDLSVAWEQTFNHGYQGMGAKTGLQYIRCLRRYTSDITPDAMNWANFDNTSSAQALTGIAAALDLQISAVNNTGTPTLEFRVNSSAWTSFTAGTSRTVPMKLNDTLQFRVTGTFTHSATITIKNQSNGGTVLDTVTGTVTDPCDGKSIGQACAGTTALYAGVFDGGKYMIMPSGCADDTSDPTCSGGADALTKTWNDGTTNYYDIPGITNITSAATASSSSERGHVTTPLIVAITAPAEGGLHAAARYCDDMVYGGYDNWYLPSKSELAYIYCKSTPSSPNASYPNENPNCGGSGPSNELTGFANSYYWSSTEFNDYHAWLQDFTNGYQANTTKDASLYVRCLRRY